MLAWFEDHGLRWGLRDQHHVARLCLAASGVEAPEGGVWPDASIDAKSLAQVLALPKLPEDHSELQALLGHLRKMSHLLGSERQGEIGHTKQEVRAQGDDLEVLRGRVEVLESSIPCFGRWFGTALFRRFGTCSLITKHPFWCVLLILRGYIYIYAFLGVSVSAADSLSAAIRCPWSLPVDLWQELMQAPVPPLPEEALKMVSDAVAHARRKPGMRNVQGGVQGVEVQGSWGDSQGRYRSHARPIEFAPGVGIRTWLMDFPRQLDGVLSSIQGKRFRTRKKPP